MVFIKSTQTSWNVQAFSEVSFIRTYTIETLNLSMSYTIEILNCYHKIHSKLTFFSGGLFHSKILDTHNGCNAGQDSLKCLEKKKPLFSPIKTTDRSTGQADAIPPPPGVDAENGGTLDKTPHLGKVTSAQLGRSREPGSLNKTLFRNLRSLS
jgi:hypothetical protein